MIILKIIKAILPVCDVKNSKTKLFVSKSQVDNFGALFSWKWKLNENENGSLLF